MLRLARMPGGMVATLVTMMIVAGCATTGGPSVPTGLPSPTSLPSPSPSPSPSPDSSSKPSSKPSTSSGSSSSGDSSSGETSKRKDGSADTGVPGEGDARTPEEKRSGVDGKLDESLGSFDDQLRREQQRTAEERDARAAGRGDATAVDEAQRSGQEQASSGRDRSGDLKSEGSQKGESGGSSGDQATVAMPQGGGGAAASKAIPSGEDDDIIARRLRKAAETETDPELKEKLWKEYRDYKENTRGGA